MNVRIAPIHDVANDRAEAVLAQLVSENAAAQHAERLHRIEMFNTDRVAILKAKA